MSDQSDKEIERLRAEIERLTAIKVKVDQLVDAWDSYDITESDMDILVSAYRAAVAINDLVMNKGSE